MSRAWSEGPARQPAHIDEGWWGAEGISIRYRERLALDQVSFRAVPGAVSAVVGGDGAGRTTLLRCLAGVVAPWSGRVGRPAPRQIGYLPAGSGIYPDLSVADNLAFRAAAYRVAPADARRRAADLLERAGLVVARDRLAGRLSGGMRQKLGVIAAMLHHPDLLVLDEPTTGVDPVSRADLWWLITRAAADGAAVVLATSYLDEAERAAHVLALDAGRELARGTPGQIVASMPGNLWMSAERPQGEAARRAWRREGRWRIWEPDGAYAVPGGAGGPGTGAPAHEPGVGGPSDGPGVVSTAHGPGAAPAGMVPVAPDLQDAVTVAALRRELMPSGGGAR